VIELAKGSAIRIPPQTVRGIWNAEPEDAEIVIVSRRIADPQGDVETVEGFWPD
jgi:quercetin dioxygenase-like cupin family protein